MKSFRILSTLLCYPDAELRAAMPEIVAALREERALPASRLAAIEALAHRVANGDPYEVESRYVQLFDRGRSTSLHLFEHVHGDSRDRGQAMVDLLAMYRDAGVELATDQLPDYLPAFLEYASLLEPKQAREQLREVTHLVRPIGSVLAARGADYAALFDVLLALAGEAALDAEADAEDDTSFAAIDAAWLDAPVDFLGAATPCTSAPNPATEQPIQFQRRAA